MPTLCFIEIRLQKEVVMVTRNFTTRNGTTLPFSTVGLGTAPLGDLYEKLDEIAAIATIEAAYAGGVTLFDTSPHYGNGLAEVRLGSGLRRADRSRVIISTKVGRVMDPMAKPEAQKGDVISPGFAGYFPHKARFDYSYDGTMRSIEQSLLRMGLDRLDIVLIHDCDVWTHGEADAPLRFKEAMDGAYKALDRLRSEKLIAAIGVGVNESDIAAKFAKTADFDVMMLAGRYSLLVQNALDEFLPLAQKKNIGVMLAGVFNSGILATGAIPGARFNYVPASSEMLERVKKIESICHRHQTSIRQAALQFSLGHPSVVSVVLGAVKAEEIQSNLADSAITAPAALWDDLKISGLLDATAPTPL